MQILKKWWWLFLIILLLVVGGVIMLKASDKVLAIFGVKSKEATAMPSDYVPEPEPEKPAPPDPKRPVNILLLGYGGAGHDGGFLTDSMILAQIVPHEEKVYLMNIPRDLWVNVPGHEGQEAKINYIYSLGAQKYATVNGGVLAAQTVAEIVGEPIDYYAAVDFTGFKKALQTLTDGKGLEVEVPYTFTDSFYPIEGKQNDPCGLSDEEIASLSAELKGYDLEKQFTCRYETITYNKGKQTLMPDELLKFVRSRHSGVGGGDFGRSQRQQALIAAAKKKVFSFDLVTKAPALYEQYKKMVDTDLDVELVSRAISNWDNMQNYEMKNIVISNQNVLKDGRSHDGQYILLPAAREDDYSELREFMRVSKIGFDWEDYKNGLATGSANATTISGTTGIAPTGVNLEWQAVDLSTL